MRKLLTLIITALLVLGGAVLATPGAHADDLGPYGQICVNGVCTRSVGPVCVSDQPTCPYRLPVCWYNGEEPANLKLVSCHEDRPKPTGTETGVCIYDPTNPSDPPSQLVCVGFENAPSDGHGCEWYDWLRTHTTSSVPPCPPWIRAEG